MTTEEGHEPKKENVIDEVKTSRTGYQPTSQLINTLMNTQLPPEIRDCLQAEISQDFPLGNLNEFEMNYFFYNLQNRQEFVVARFPHRDSLVQGDLRRMIYGEDLNSLDSQERYNLAAAFDAIWSRTTRGRGGYQQNKLSEQITESRQVANPHTIGARKRSFWDKVFGSE
jgi:hypothetical protein